MTDYEPKQSNAKRHHYVPVFLLRRFTDASERLFQLDKQSGKPSKCAPADAACIKWFYRYRGDDGAWQNDLESALADVEDLAARALERMGAVDILSGSEDRSTIAGFLALQSARTPYGQGVLLAASKPAALAHLEMTIQNESAERLAEVLGGEGGPLTLEEAERQRQEMLDDLAAGRIDVEIPNEWGLHSMLQSVVQTGPLIEGMSWTLLHTDISAPFVLSDTPLTMWNPDPLFPWSGDAWFSGPRAESTLPLSSTLCLHLTPHGPDFSSRAVSRKDVDRINLRTYGWADRWVYARSQQTLQDLRRLAKARPDLVSVPRPARTVILEEADPDDSPAPPQRGWPSGLWVDGRHYMKYDVSTEEVRRRRR